MRTGAEYREALRDGRKVWLLGTGPIDDVTTHPLTKGMVDAYVKWYDRHFDPQWQDIVLTPPDKKGERRPVAFEIPKTAQELRRLGKEISSVHFTTGGNMTHTPGYGALISLGILDTVKMLNLAPEDAEKAAAYRDMIARTGRFLTFSSGGPPVGFRFREEEKDRASVRVVKERDDGLVISGKVAMHTSTPFAEDVLVTSGTQRNPDSEHRSWFIVSVATPGVRVIARKASARYENRFMSPLTHRFDELDAQLWLEDVFVPWERIFTVEGQLGPLAPGPTDDSEESARRRASSLASWLFWHQHYGWLAKLEFTLGLALAAADAMGLKENAATVEQLTDAVVDVQTSRSCVLAAELDPDLSTAGHLLPGQKHVAVASLNTLKARQRVTEIARGLPGSSLVVAPVDTDFDDPKMASDLEEAFGGGGYTARQRSALLQLIWDHVSSGLDGRESTFEMHANGGIAMWRSRMRTLFDSYNQLANGVLQAIDIEMPAIDVAGIRGVMPWSLRRQPPRLPGGGAAPPTDGSYPAAPAAAAPGS